MSHNYLHSIYRTALEQILKLVNRKTKQLIMDKMMTKTTYNLRHGERVPDFILNDPKEYYFYTCTCHENEEERYIDLILEQFVEEDFGGW